MHVGEVDSSSRLHDTPSISRDWLVHPKLPHARLSERVGPSNDNHACSLHSLTSRRLTVTPDPRINVAAESQKEVSSRLRTVVALRRR
jgi:hypothetical protein